MYSLENDKLKILVNSVGAELSSVVDLETGFEFMYDGNPNFWKRHAPNLFPIVGRLLNDTYMYNGESYHMTQHGFARDSEFKIIEETVSTLAFELTESEETLVKYPFRFSYIVKYELITDTIKVTYQVTNPDTTELLFSVGAHPAFAFDEGQDIDDYKVTFNPPINDIHYKLEDSYINPTPFVNKRKISEIDISMKTFEDGVLIFDQPINIMTLESKKSNHKITVGIEGIPYVGIWTALSDTDKTPFLCIEPWEGLADLIGHDGKLETKEGIKRLQEKEIFSSTYTLKFKK